jgi:hypothetical protein
MVISRHAVLNYLLVFQNNKGGEAKVGRVALVSFSRKVLAALIENYFDFV